MDEAFRSELHAASGGLAATVCHTAADASIDGPPLLTEAIEVQAIGGRMRFRARVAASIGSSECIAVWPTSTFDPTLWPYLKYSLLTCAWSSRMQGVLGPENDAVRVAADMGFRLVDAARVVGVNLGPWGDEGGLVP